MRRWVNGNHVGAWSASGQPQRELSYHAFDYWRRFVLKQDMPQAAFIQVEALPPPAPECGAAIEVQLASGTRLVRPDTRALHELAQLLRLLEA